MKVALTDWVLSRKMLLAANFVLAAAGGLCAAYWLWAAWTAYGGSTAAAKRNASQPTVTADARATAAQAVNAHLFGRAGKSGEAGGQAVTTLNLKLVGTFSGWRSKPGYALIANDSGKPAPFSRGAEVSRGVVLGEIAADHVTLLRNGVTERLNLSSKSDLKLTPEPAKRTSAPAANRR